MSGFRTGDTVELFRNINAFNGRGYHPDGMHLEPLTSLTAS